MVTFPLPRMNQNSLCTSAHKYPSPGKSRSRHSEELFKGEHSSLQRFSSESQIRGQSSTPANTCPMQQELPLAPGPSLGWGQEPPAHNAVEPSRPQVLFWDKSHGREGFPFSWEQDFNGIGATSHLPGKPGMCRATFPSTLPKWISSFKDFPLY